MSAAVQAFGPAAVAILAVLLAWSTGLDQHTVLPPLIEARFYGFFLDRYPLFAAALVYGLARIGFAMIRTGKAGLVRRLLGGAVAIGLLLGASLYPTFGGFVLRSAFATGGIAFLGQQPMAIAYGLGAAAAAFLFGLVFGAGNLLVVRRPVANDSWRRRLLRGTGHIAMRYLSLWFALATLGLADALGFGAWPRRPLSETDALLAAALVFVAFLPHGCLDWILTATGSTSGRGIDQPDAADLIRTAGYGKIV
ncbi:hypothetical protein G3T14_17160 [Methylobacterium sp. BTF04]|uniref:hypothetical protein n=1 Tax=Methylobacterium sp. BTF04 TaxID=2708300 RepID=UPI0013CFD929|nr:hypothetical protein [Methylobacterium sp. BTF04]NEU13842.1 hypothetical protein [Methylobacterium sp. BTF04]